MDRAIRTCVLVGGLSLASANVAEATEWFVARGGSGAGTSAAPFGRIQDGLNAAQPGDTVTVLSGSYGERLATVRNGTSAARIRLRAAAGPGSVLVTIPGRVLTVRHSYISIEGFILDGQYGLDDAVLVATSGHFFRLADSEVRRSTRDLIDIRGPAGVVIERCLIHHALNAADGRTDAHGIAAGPVQDLAIRDTDIHTFSGDGIQVDPGRSAPGWSRVTIERSRIWLVPLPAPENGFPAGTVPGENAVDTKASASFPRAILTIRDTTASGFRSALISNAAAFNLKEHVDATVDRVTVSDSEIAFRLRGAATGGAWVAVTNTVVFDTSTAFRYEDNIRNLRIWNSTVGGGVARAFQAASSDSAGLDVRNLLVLGTLPAEAAGPSNLGVGAAAFVNAAADDYALSASSPAIDAGVAIAQVTTDITGLGRPQGAAYDVGAYEFRLAAPVNLAPTSVLTSPSACASFTAPANITLAADASDADGSINDVGFLVNGALVGRDTTPPFSMTVANVAAGTYTLTALATDNAGATTMSGAVQVTVAAAPPPLTLSTRAVKAPGVWRVDLSWTPSGSGSLTVFRNGTVRTTTANDGAYADNVGHDASGKYVYKVCLVTTPSVCSNESTAIF